MKTRVRDVSTKLLILPVVLLFAVCALLSAVFSPRAAARAEEFAAEGKAAYLMDAATGTVLYSENENTKSEKVSANSVRIFSASVRAVRISAPVMPPWPSRAETA